MKFLIDTQLPPKLSKYLFSKNFDSKHTTQYPKAEFLQDSEIIKIAKDEERIIITKDLDFEEYFFLNGPPPKIIRLNIGNSTNNTLLKIFENNLSKIIILLDEHNLIIINADLKIHCF